MSSDIQRRPYRFLAVAAVGTFMGTLEGSILNVALPTIAADLGVAIDVVAWVVLAYSLTLVSLMMVFGGWAARTGYGFAYRFGYIVFLAGTIICVFSHSFYPLIFGRVVQAVGSAMFQAIGMGLVTTVFPPEQRGKGIGMMAMVVAAGLMTGPPLGGLLLDIWPWRAIFVAALPVGVAGMALSILVFRSFKAEISQRRVNLRSAISLSTALLSGMFWLSLMDQFSLADWRLLGLALICLAGLYSFYRAETQSDTPLIGLDLFRNRQFMSAMSAMFLMFSALAGVLILMPFYLQDVQHRVPLEVGMFLIILPVTMAFVAPVAGRLSDRMGYRLLTSLGMLVLLIGQYLLTRLEPNTSTTYIVLSLTAVGIGVGIFNSPNSSAMMGSVTERQRTIASGVLSTTRAIGMAVGIALATALFSLYQSRFAGLGGEAIAFVSSLRQVVKLAMLPVVVGLAICLIRKNHIAGSPSRPD